MSFLWYWPDGGWDFAAWRTTHAWDPVVSEQSGTADPLPLVRLWESGPEGLERWHQDRTTWQRISDELLGTVSDLPPRRVRWEYLGPEFVVADSPNPSTMRRLRYTLTDVEWGYAWLLAPQRDEGPRPAVIALHQTSPSGKAEVVGLEVRDSASYMQYAAELAARGFVVLAPDAVAFGERQAGHPNAHYRSAAEFFHAHPEGSVMAKMSFDVSRAIDLLEALPQADASRIGCIGHSHGAYGTLFAMVSDPRIRAGVVSCGLNLLRADPSPERWWSKTALIPRLGCYAAIEQTPLDFHHWLALVAPRPLMIVAGTQDLIFPNVGDARWLALVRQVYALYGAENALHSWIFDGAHAFPEAAREDAYRMLADALG